MGRHMSGTRKQKGRERFKHHKPPRGRARKQANNERNGNGRPLRT